MSQITIHSTKQTVEVEVVDRGLATHRDSDGAHGGRHRRKYARDAFGVYYRLNKHGHWTAAVGRTLVDAELAFAQDSRRNVLA